MSTPEEKAAARKAERERRQNRIRASGTNRLAKITGTAGSKDFKPPPSTQPKPAEIRQSTPNTSSQPDPLLQFLQQNGQGSDASSDPLLKLLSGARDNGNAFENVGADGTNSPQGDLQQQQQQHFANAQRRSKQRADAKFTWDVVHFLISIMLGLYAALGNPWRIGAAFLTLEMCLLATKLVLGHYDSGLNSVPMLGPLMGMLPKNRQRQFNVAGAIIRTIRTAYKDMAIALFVYGCASRGGKDFVRPPSYQ